MKIATRRFGEVEIDDKKIITFPQGIPGFENVGRYTLISHDKTYPISWLQAVDVPYISLPVIDPFTILPEYAFDVSDNDVADLALNAKSDLYILSVVVIPENIKKMTVNLSAPILINIRTNLGKQIIIDGRDYELRRPIFELVCKKFREVSKDARTDPKSE